MSSGDRRRGRLGRWRGRLGRRRGRWPHRAHRRGRALGRRRGLRRRTATVAWGPRRRRRALAGALLAVPPVFLYAQPTLDPAGAGLDALFDLGVVLALVVAGLRSPRLGGPLLVAFGAALIAVTLDDPPGAQRDRMVFVIGYCAPLIASGVAFTLAGYGREHATAAAPAPLPEPPEPPLAPNADPFDLLEPEVRERLVLDLIADSDRGFRLTRRNAEAALRNGPPGTRPNVAGAGVNGAGVEFVDDHGSVVLRRECRSVVGGYNSFDAHIKHAARQTASRGEVWVQVRQVTDVERWIRRWQGTRDDARLRDHAALDVVFRDADGRSLGRYNLGTRLSP